MGATGEVRVGLRFEGRRTAAWRPLEETCLAEIVSARPWRRQVTHHKEQLVFGLYTAASTGGRIVAADGVWDRLDAADHDPEVQVIIGQPFQLRAAHGPGQQGHVPDLLLADRHGRITLVDGTPTAGGLRPSQEVVEWAAQAASSRGWRHEWWQGPEDPRPLLTVAALAASKQPPRGAGRRLIEPVLDLCTAREHSVGEIEDHFASAVPHRLVRETVHHLLWWGDLITDLRMPIGLGTRVRTDSCARRPAPARWTVGTRLQAGGTRVVIVRATAHDVVIRLDGSPRAYGIWERRVPRAILARQATALPAAYQQPLLLRQASAVSHSVGVSGIGTGATCPLAAGDGRDQ
ncbi:TnsA-like heteromeric transposase endonuclease subunit [Streptomyces sp. NPDC054796]